MTSRQVVPVVGSGLLFPREHHQVIGRTGSDVSCRLIEGHLCCWPSRRYEDSGFFDIDPHAINGQAVVVEDVLPAARVKVDVAGNAIDERDGCEGFILTLYSATDLVSCLLPCFDGVSQRKHQSWTIGIYTSPLPAWANGAFGGLDEVP
jgi:hypothetical protein